MTRRDSLEKIFQLLVLCGASSFFTFEDLLAIEEDKIDKPDLIWLHGLSCSGCSTSFFNVEHVPFMDLITKYTNLIFHPDISLATGDQVIKVLNQSKMKNCIVLLEGSIPLSLPHACLMGDKPISQWLEIYSKNAKLCISIGTCSSFGGITSMQGMQTGAVSYKTFLDNRNISKPYIALPGCPLKPEHLVYALFYFIKYKTLPPLDSNYRPKHFFERTVHDRCIFYADYQENNFAKFIGDDGCLFKLGCQGIVTKNDCLITGYNGNTNVCIRAGHPCVGCSSEHFPRQIMFHTYQEKRIIKNFKIS